MNTPQKIYDLLWLNNKQDAFEIILSRTKEIWTSIRILPWEYDISKQHFDSLSLIEQERKFQKLILSFVSSEQEYQLFWEAFQAWNLDVILWERKERLTTPFNQYSNYKSILEAFVQSQKREIFFLRLRNTFH
mgnify:CR=1 FL=1